MLSVQGVSKQYGPLLALRDVTIDFQPGVIHAVLGENGAGKSTLMGVLSGFVKPSAGQVTFNNQPVPLGRPSECKRMGIEMIHQHFTLVSEFTVEENLALVNLPSLSKLINISERAEKALAWGQRLGWNVDPRAKVRNLPVGTQQRIEILKALSGEAEVLIFDEPTAVLSGEEVTDLFRVLRDLKQAGKTVILIAHKLSEIMEIADEVTVLRRGEKVAFAKITDVTAAQLAEWMVGEIPPTLAPPSGGEPGECVLQVEHLSVLGDRGETAVRDVSFSVNAGSILGIGGVDGNGQVELAEALVGVRKPQSGRVDLATGVSVGYVPQDRQIDGLALTMSVIDNMLVTGRNRDALHRGPFLRRRTILNWVRDLMTRFEVKAEGPTSLLKSMSGGNQQKVVVSRTLDQTPNLLVVLSPTRGLDIRATQYVRSKILEARNQGAAVVLFSADLDELASLASETVFLSRGRLERGSLTDSLTGGVV